MMINRVSTDSRIKMQTTVDEATICECSPMVVSQELKAAPKLRVDSEISDWFVVTNIISSPITAMSTTRLPCVPSIRRQQLHLEL